MGITRRHALTAAMTALLAALPVVWAAADEPSPRLDLLGDFRVRYEGNSAVGEGPERHRGVLRLRLGATFEVNELLEVGARVATGDPDDPRTTDVTMGDFVDDLEVSLDLAFLELRLDRGVATAGKVRNPFTTTELVWDSDVNPLGVAGWLDSRRTARPPALVSTSSKPVRPCSFAS